MIPADEPRLYRTMLAAEGRFSRAFQAHCRAEMKLGQALGEPFGRGSYRIRSARASRTLRLFYAEFHRLSDAKVAWARAIRPAWGGYIAHPTRQPDELALGYLVQRGVS